MKNKISVLVLTVFYVMLLGCSNIATQAVALTPITYPTQSKTLQPMQPTIEIPSPLASRTITPPPTSIIPDIQETLTPYVESSRVTQLIKNPPCSLPCWWGVLPGQTRWADTSELFALLNLIKTSSPISVASYTKHQYIANSSSNIYHTTIDVFDKDGVVDYIITSPFLSLADFRAAWSNYNPKNIIAVYGEPTRVLITSDRYGEPNYQLLLFYDNQGILLRYFGKANSSTAQSMVVCPDIRKGNLFGLTIYVQPSSVVTPIEEFPVENIDLSDFHNIQDAANLSISEFVSVFNGESSSYCLSVSI